jgi:Na+/H+-dicarboxylate symporter
MDHNPTDRLPMITTGHGFLAMWRRTPLYARIVGAMLLGIGTGFLINHTVPEAEAPVIGKYFADVGKLILRLLTMIALPLIFVAIVHVLLKAKVNATTARRLFTLLLTNTLVAITIGLFVGNVVAPGQFASLEPTNYSLPSLDMWEELKKKIPESFVGSLVPNWETGRQEIIPAIVIALGLGIALRRVREQQAQNGDTGVQSVTDFFEALYSALLVALHWIIALIPIAVFGIVSNVVATQGLNPFVSLLGFIAAVLLALFLQACYYLLRVYFQSWVSPMQFLRGGAEALITAFSTASSTAAAPLNFACLRENIGLREESASLGALVGSNFNNDGTALYEAMGPMYIAQALGHPLPLSQQPVVALMAVLASVGAPGIPEAGLVTMVLVFQAVGLPTEYVAFLLPVDWFLDRCRTMVNLMGDMSVACVLDGKVPEQRAPLIETPEY